MKKTLIALSVALIGCYAPISSADYSYAPDRVYTGVSIGIGEDGVVIRNDRYDRYDRYDRRYSRRDYCYRYPERCDRYRERRGDSYCDRYPGRRECRGRW